jgi:hypothetical protein
LLLMYGFMSDLFECGKDSTREALRVARQFAVARQPASA